MSTLTFIPKNKGEYILTFNKDSRKNKPQTEAKEQIIGKHLVKGFYDVSAGGMSFATSNKGRSACLLNGAFSNHIRKLKYIRNKHELMVKVFEFGDISSFMHSVNFSDYEPFTLVIIDRKNKTNKIIELRWDGRIKHTNELLPNQSYIWSSATVYSSFIHSQKNSWFNYWLKNSDISPESLMALHVNKPKKKNGMPFRLENHDTYITTDVIQASYIDDCCRLKNINLINKLNDELSFQQYA